MTQPSVSNDDIMKTLNEFANNIDKRFDGIDQRLFRVEQDIATIKTDILNLQKSHDHLLNTVDKFIARIISTKQSKPHVMLSLNGC